MDQAMQGRCQHCRADLSTTDFTCPNCGRYVDGGFEFNEIRDGFRAALLPSSEPLAAGSLDEAETMIPGFLQSARREGDQQDRFDHRPGDAPSPATPSGQRSASPSPELSHEVHLPEIGGITDLPYARDTNDTGRQPVIDLRDKPEGPDSGDAEPRARRSWLRRRRSLT